VSVCVWERIGELYGVGSVGLEKKVELKFIGISNRFLLSLGPTIPDFGPSSPPLSILHFPIADFHSLIKETG
jgi:hypothetical protein